MKRKIAIVTGTRAEYGLLYWLMKAIADDEDLTLQVIATGTHLCSEFGFTYKQIHLISVQWLQLTAEKVLCASQSLSVQDIKGHILHEFLLQHILFYWSY